MRGDEVKVSLFTDTFGDLNGVSRFLRDAADEAERTGRDLEIVTCGPGNETHPVVRNHRPHAARPYRRYPDLQWVVPPVWSMIRETRRRDPDIIHISTPGPVGVVGLMAATLLNKPVTGIYHTDFPAYIRRLYGPTLMARLADGYMRGFYGRFEAVFTRSRDYIDILRDLGLDPAMLHDLPPGMDTSRFHPRHRDADVWTEMGLTDRPKVLYVGRISREKNLEFLAATWQAFRKGGGDAELVFIGDGPLRPQLEATLGGPDVHFLGTRHGDELARLYASADLFAFPSVTDTLGQVVMEAQASGLPALVSDEGGPRLVVQDGTTGRVLPVDAPEAWAAAIQDWLDHPEIRKDMGAAARRRMQTQSFAQSFEAWWTLQEAAWRRCNDRWNELAGPAVVAPA